MASVKDNLHIQVEETKEGRSVLIEFVVPQPEFELVED